MRMRQPRDVDLVSTRHQLLPEMRNKMYTGDTGCTGIYMRMRSRAMWTWFQFGISYYPEMRIKTSTGNTGCTGI